MRVHVHRTVVDLHLTTFINPAEGVLHPRGIVTVWEVLTSVGTATLLTSRSALNSLNRIGHGIPKLQSLNKVSVEDKAAVTDANVAELIPALLHLNTTLIQRLLGTEYSSIPLHALLQLEAQVSSWHAALGVANLSKNSMLSWPALLGSG